MSAPLFVKICGVQTKRDVDAAVQAGADAIGFVFSDGSSRRVDALIARQLVLRVPEHILTVGVFRGQSVQEVRTLAQVSGVRGIQLHGNETRAHYDALRQQRWSLIRAISIRDQTPRCGEFDEDILLLDAPVPGAGIPWDWASKDFIRPIGRWLLAGGLTPRNVQDAIRATKPWGVDVSSGVEVRRGTKDPILITSFIEAARSAK